MIETRARARDLGIAPGLLSPGPLNAITDVAGVRVGHTTIVRGEGPLVRGQGPVRTGVTAILPHEGNTFREKVTAAVVRINGFGEVMNSEQVHEMGVIDSPILITNTFNTARVADALIEWALERDPTLGVTTWGLSPVVAETSDLWLNDIGGRHVGRDHVFHALETASAELPGEGNVGGGTGMICYEFKGGIGTASRRLSPEQGGFTVGVLVQANFGARPYLTIWGAPVGRQLETFSLPITRPTGGSIIVVIATDAPMSHRQLTRLGMRATHGIARTGSISANTSGDFAIAFSTTRRRPHQSEELVFPLPQVVESSSLISTLFAAAVEATEEAILNALFKAETMVGRDDRVVYALPIPQTVEILQRFGHPEVHLP